MSEFGIFGKLPTAHPSGSLHLRGDVGRAWAGPLCAMAGSVGRLRCAHPPASLPTAEAYVGGMLFCLGIFLSFYLLTILLACWENWR